MSTLGFEIKEKVLSLQSALLANDPRMPVLLRDIHTHLRADPEIVTLMAEEDINIIVQGLQKQTNSVISQAVLKPKSAVNKSLKKITVDDI